MHLWSKVRRSPAENARVAPSTSFDVLYEKPDRPLKFWHIQPHDRKTLADNIMPYMAGRLPKRYLLQTIMQREGWASGLVNPDLAGAGAEGLICLHKIKATFWEEPTNVIADLLRLTRLWFFALVRFTYRERYLEGDRTSREDLDEQDINARTSQGYDSELTESEVYRLTCIPNKYGATFYRRSYKSVKRCLYWSSFCTRIQTLCSMIGLHVSSDNPEWNIRELRYNLTAIMMHRKCLQINIRLDRNTVLVRNTKRGLEELDERIASDAVRDLKASETTKQDIADLQLGLHKLRLACPKPSNLNQRDTKLLSEMENRRLASEQEFKRLRSDIEACEAKSQELTMTITKQIDELRSNLVRTHTPREGEATAESLIICRWLLEHLPLPEITQAVLGRRWKQFWENQWAQIGKKSERHPLKGLAGDESYKKIGKNLYGTLSDRLHKYGHQQGDRLDPRVQRLVDAISPVHYCSDGKVDLAAERRRWLE